MHAARGTPSISARIFVIEQRAGGKENRTPDRRSPVCYHFEHRDRRIRQEKEDCHQVPDSEKTEYQKETSV